VRWLALVALGLLGFAPRAWAADADHDAKTSYSTKLIPLPLYAFLPNEGSTYGVLPVFLRVNDADQSTAAILAPSVSWNKVVHVTGTVRLFVYPQPERETITVIGSFSTQINRTIITGYVDLPQNEGDVTTELSLIAKRNAFYRFFGIGPDTPFSNQTSYTRLFGDFVGRVGYNLRSWLNVGLIVEARGDRVEGPSVPGLPFTQDVFPEVPGVLHGAAYAAQSLSLRLDTREHLEYSTTGVFSQLDLGIIEGITGTPTFGRFIWDTRAIVSETSRVLGAARLYLVRNEGGDSTIPFFYQASLGGEFLLRGYMPDRFIDRNAWTFDLEQRIRAFQTDLFGVTADWRIDPFVTVGEVYNAFSNIVSSPKAAVGLGFRAWVHPSVVGRVDVAYSFDGFNAYVDIGYPF